VHVMGRRSHMSIQLHKYVSLCIQRPKSEQRKLLYRRNFIIFKARTRGYVHLDIFIGTCVENIVFKIQ
jgi:hypothetical protein